MGAKLSVQKCEVPAERTFVVTGANTGIGYQTSKKIAQLGGRVILACRSEEKAKKAIEQIQEENRQEVRAKRKAEKDAAEKERQQKEAAAAKEQQERERQEERKKKEEAKKAQAKKDEETAKGEEKKEDGEKKAEETENKTEEKPAEDGEKPAEDDKPAEGEKPAEEAEKPAEEEAKAAEGGDKPVESGDKSEEGATEEAAAPAAKEDGDAPAEAEPEPEEEIPELKLQFMPLDLASFKSVLEFVKQFKDSELPLHTLICNGGLIAPTKVITDDGLESSFQINYLSHFLLTLHLLPLLKASAPGSKIINVTSSGHKTGDGVNLANIQSQKSFSQGRAYANSKLFQIMNTFTLHSKIKDTGIDVFSVHPGFVDTQFTRGYSGFLKAVSLFHKGFGRNSTDGAATTLTAVLDEQYNGKGPIYFASCKPSQPSNLSRNEEQQNTLWRYSLELLREHLDDTILAEIGETLESIQPKEPEPEPTPAAEGDDKKEEETKEEKEGEGEEAAKSEDKKEDAGGEDKEKEAAASQETEEKEKEEEKPSEEKKEDGEAEKKDEE